MIDSDVVIFEPWIIIGLVVLFAVLIVANIVNFKDLPDDGRYDEVEW